MVYKTLKKTSSCNISKGFTIVELLVVISIIMILITTTILLINPAEQYKKARDEKRLSDLTVLDRLINEYKIDNERYPDLENVLRVSTTLPPGNSGPHSSTQQGWITGNFSGYSATLPIDPLNNSDFYYSYMHTGFAYELNARLEYFTKLAEDDGGNNPSIYEIGDDLTIL
jgi:type II secretory pathway pseudopilin PulG